MAYAISTKTVTSRDSIHTKNRRPQAIEMHLVVDLRIEVALEENDRIGTRQRKTETFDFDRR
jgi:hypothetical protein